MYTDLVYPITLLNLLISGFLWIPYDFLCTWSCHPQRRKFCFFLSNPDDFHFFYCLKALVTTASTILNRSGKSDSLWVNFCIWTEVWVEVHCFEIGHPLVSSPLKRWSLLYWIAFSSLSKINWPYLHGSNSRFCSIDPCVYSFTNTTFSL